MKTTKKGFDEIRNNLVHTKLQRKLQIKQKLINITDYMKLYIM